MAGDKSCGLFLKSDAIYRTSSTGCSPGTSHALTCASETGLESSRLASGSEPSSSIRFRTIRVMLSFSNVVRFYCSGYVTRLDRSSAPKFAEMSRRTQPCACSRSHSRDITKYAPSKAANSKSRTGSPNCPAASLRRIDTLSPFFHRNPAI